jgi:hypothetical protein
VRTYVHESFDLGVGQFPLFRILQQPVFSINSQYDVEDSQWQRRHGVYSGHALISAFFNAGLSIKFQIFLGRYPSCMNGGFGDGDSQANQARSPRSRSMKDVSNDQSTEQSLAVSHQILPTVYTAQGFSFSLPTLRVRGKRCGLSSGTVLGYVKQSPPLIVI